MMNRKLLSLILCLTIGVSLTACSDNNNTVTTTETTTEVSVSEELTEKIPSDTFDDNNQHEETTDKVSTTSEKEFTDVPSSVADTTNLTVTAVSTTVSAKSLSELTFAEIADTYKKAAIKSASSVKSRQSISLSSVSINNGQYENVIEFIMPIMSKFLSNNSKETDGITGGYENITGTDIAQAKIYAIGKNKAIEMVMKEQTDGADSDSFGGTVGHAITTVGDINIVADQFNDLGLPIEISAENTVIRYTNPVVKVLIGPDGKIINGTWSYTVEITLNDYYVGKSPVETTTVVLDNVITVNGGFSK